MKKLEALGVKELSYSSTEIITGGSWFGEKIGKLVGSLIRYAGPYGAAQLQIDAAMNEAIN
ncbi:MAG: hypothetical protein HKP49_06975 [Maribacter sp.]|nr:hypothetical protein [Maribacter sp.]